MKCSGAYTPCMKKNNLGSNKKWAVIAIAALVVVGGAWAGSTAIGGTELGLSAAVLKANLKPPTLPPAPKPVATTTAPKPATTTAAKAAVAPVSPGPAALCASGAQRKTCEDNAIAKGMAVCTKAKKKCTVRLTFTESGALASVTPTFVK